MDPAKYDEMPLGSNGAKGLSFLEQLKIAEEKEKEKLGIKEEATKEAEKKEEKSSVPEVKNEGKSCPFDEVKEIDVSGLTLEERINHKNFKVKKDAVEEIIGKIKDMETFDEELFNLFPSLLNVANLIEQIEDALKSFFDKNIFIPKGSQDALNELIKNLVDKGFSNLRKTTKEKSIPIIIAAIECLTSTDTLSENIVNMLKSKNAKINQGGVGICTVLFNAFGISVFNYKKINEAVAKLSEHCSPLIKKEIVEFYIEEFKWLRKSVKALIEGKLKDAIKQDIYKVIDPLEEQYAKNGPNFRPKNPEHFIGNKKAVNTEIENNMQNEGKVNSQFPQNQNIADDLEAEGIDVFTKKNGFDEKFIKLLSDKKTKWKVKVEELGRFVQVTDKIYKIKNTNRKDFMELIRLMLKDANINVIQETIKVIRNLSKGLGKDFREAKELFYPLLDLFKNKKESLISFLMEAFEHMIKYMDDNSICESIIKYSNKQICSWSKINLCKLISDKIMLTKSNIGPLMKLVIFKLMDDPALEVRQEATRVMSLFKNQREDIFENEKGILDKSKLKKIEDYITSNKVQKIDVDKSIKVKCTRPKTKVNSNKAFSLDEDIEMEEKFDDFEDKIKLNKRANNFNRTKININKTGSNHSSNSSKSSRYNKSNSSSSNYSSRRNSKEKEKKSRSRNVSLNNSRGRNQSAPGSLNRGGGLINKTIQASHKETNISRFGLKNTKKSENIQQIIDLRPDLNEGERSIVESNIPNNILNNLKSEKWNERKCGFEALNQCFSENISFDELNNNIELYLRFILMNTKEFKEMNLQIIKEALNCLTTLCERIPTFTATFSSYLINILLNKISDKKFCDPIFKFFEQMISVQREEPRAIINIFIRRGKTKSAYVQRELGLFLGKIINDAYNIQMFPIKELIEFAIFLEDTPNSQCRNSGTAILTQLYFYLSKDLNLFLTKLKDSTFKRIEKELSKFETKVNSKENKEKLKRGAELVNRMFPPVDISKKINGEIIRKIKGGKWDEKI